VLVVLAVSAIAAWRLRRNIGVWRLSLLSATLASLAIYWLFLAQPRPVRSLTWLSAFIGVGTLILAALGTAITWKQRYAAGNNGFLLLLLAVTGGVIIYNAHVYPALPWAIRRFVPFLVPVTILLAAISVDAARRRSLAVGALGWAVLVVSVLAPARQLWGREYYAGTSEQYEEFVATLPRDGVFLIHRGLVPFLLGIPMWLLDDIDTLPVDMQQQPTLLLAARAIGELQESRAVYYVQPTLAEWRPHPALPRELVTDFTFQIALPQQTTDSVPTRLERYSQSVSVYRISPLQPSWIGRAIEKRASTRT
jgi:hypothetical protein